ncbi:hypothetical protein MKEN_00352000 [Mycena kentingensis (nom. inval.)]|nr:hypothetical protein MKEN_00352000 [Mycena kentingensis (nom. inval.)]
MSPGATAKYNNTQLTAPWTERGYIITVERYKASTAVRRDRCGCDPNHQALLPTSMEADAEAGPSTLFLPPTRPPQPPPNLASTHDLLTRFHLLSAYDKYVRDDAPDPPQPDNGKGKAREQAHAPSPLPQTPGGDHDGDDDDPTQPKGDKKKKNNYKHLIKGVPGKHSMKKDDFLGGIMQVPPKQPMKIAQFDLKTQREAFSVSLEGLKGWNPGALIQESAQAREDRKKRKELKRLAKAAQAQAAAAVATGSPAPFAGTPRPSIGTPRPSVGTPRPVPRPINTAAPSIPNRIGTPLAHASSTPRMSTGTPTIPHPLSAAPVSAGLPERGIKREREPDVPATVNGHVANGVYGNGNGVQHPPAQAPMFTASKAGIANARPRPLKKQKTDHPSLGMAVHQQPTPQGV